jgi:hypothetical protein
MYLAEAFMAYIEKDAEARAADKRERKAIADDYKKKANEAFRAKEYEKALDLYNKVNFRICIVNSDYSAINYLICMLSVHLCVIFSFFLRNNTGLQMQTFVNQAFILYSSRATKGRLSKAAGGVTVSPVPTLL